MIDKIEEFFLKILEKIHLKKLADWYRSHKEGMRYLVFGALTTIVNILAYSILYYICHIDNAISNVIVKLWDNLFMESNRKIANKNRTINGLKTWFFKMLFLFRKFKKFSGGYNFLK